MDANDLLIAALGIALGGFLKGATGAGAPVVGVPILALVLGVPKAVAIFSVINLISNVWQSWAYRDALSSLSFGVRFAVAGAFGAAIGTVFLAWLPTAILQAGLASLVIFYIALRLARPEWRLSRDRGSKLATAAGGLGGVMQGAGGISAPVSLPFLNSMRLDRREFIGTVSLYFLIMSMCQIPMLFWFGILDAHHAGLGLLGLVPMFAAIPVGAFAARYVSPAAFDKMILVLLAVVALRLVQTALT